MKTFVTDLAAKTSEGGHLGSFKRRLFRQQDALRYGIAPLAVAIASLIRLALTPILQDEFALPVFRAGGLWSPPASVDWGRD